MTLKMVQEYAACKNVNKFFLKWCKGWDACKDVKAVHVKMQGLCMCRLWMERYKGCACEYAQVWHVQVVDGKMQRLWMERYEGYACNDAKMNKCMQKYIKIHQYSTCKDAKMQR